MVLTEKQYDDIWTWVETELKFQPYCLERAAADTRGIVPFRPRGPYAVYGIEDMSDAHLEVMDGLILEALQAVTPVGSRLYALDWQHSGFLFDPRRPEEMDCQYVPDVRFPSGGYWAYFPPFYPDGDYYFFIDQNRSFGYLSHPWRQEVWIFGEALLPEFQKIHTKLGWKRL